MRSLKDVFCRTKRNEATVDRAMYSRPPVELGVEKELGITKEDIGSKISIEEYNDACSQCGTRAYGKNLPIRWGIGWTWTIPM